MSDETELFRTNRGAENKRVGGGGVNTATPRASWRRSGDKRRVESRRRRAAADPVHQRTGPFTTVEEARFATVFFISSSSSSSYQPPWSFFIRSPVTVFRRRRRRRCLRVSLRRGRWTVVPKKRTRHRPFSATGPRVDVDGPHNNENVIRNWKWFLFWSRRRRKKRVNEEQTKRRPCPTGWHPNRSGCQERFRR